VAKKESLAIGEQRYGIYRRSEDVYLVRIQVNGKRKTINAGNSYRGAQLLYY
jgi:hypothetical protein